mmetsp:Transcript_431/g.912  ORF Transcript_431/g.912 Transcript_431/m.912 type:complete len:229 (+) Transcript_431:164-850(+)
MPLSYAYLHLHSQSISLFLSSSLNHLLKVKQRIEKSRSLIHHSHLTHELLSRKSHHRQHGQPPMLDLRQLHPLLSFLIGRVHAQRIESVITREVGTVVIIGISTISNPLEIDRRGQSQAESPKVRRDVIQPSVQQGRNPIAPVDQRTQSQSEVGIDHIGNLAIEQFAHGPSGRGQHGDASVLHFGLAIVFQFFGRFGEVEGVESHIAGVLLGEVLRTTEEGKGGGKLG